MTERTRELLEQTGVLQTRDDTDTGHIPDFWRRHILALCDLLDSAPLDIADALREERKWHARTRVDLARREEEVAALRRTLASKTEDVKRATERESAAVLLVAEAVPRMRTLNNAMSPGWLARAALLEV